MVRRPREEFLQPELQGVACPAAANSVMSLTLRLQDAAPDTALVASHYPEECNVPRLLDHTLISMQQLCAPLASINCNI